MICSDRTSSAREKNVVYRASFSGLQSEGGKAWESGRKREGESENRAGEKRRVESLKCLAKKKTRHRDDEW